MFGPGGKNKTMANEPYCYSLQRKKKESEKFQESFGMMMMIIINHHLLKTMTNR